MPANFATQIQTLRIQLQLGPTPVPIVRRATKISLYSSEYGLFLERDLAVCRVAGVLQATGDTPNFSADCDRHHIRFDYRCSRPDRSEVHTVHAMSDAGPQLMHLWCNILTMTASSRGSAIRDILVQRKIVEK